MVTLTGLGHCEGTADRLRIALKASSCSSGLLLLLQHCISRYSSGPCRPLMCVSVMHSLIVKTLTRSGTKQFACGVGRYQH